MEAVGSDTAANFGFGRVSTPEWVGPCPPALAWEEESGGDKAAMRLDGLAFDHDKRNTSDFPNALPGNRKDSVRRGPYLRTRHVPSHIVSGHMFGPFSGAIVSAQQGQPGTFPSRRLGPQHGGNFWLVTSG
jgi:hypothetical protein